jgi:hypothetical protein
MALGDPCHSRRDTFGTKPESKPLKAKKYLQQRNTRNKAVEGSVLRKGSGRPGGTTGPSEAMTFPN